MVLIQIELPEATDKKVSYYMIDHGIRRKSEAIVQIVKEKLGQV